MHYNTSLTGTWKDTDLRTSSQRAVRTDRLSATAGVSQTFYGLFHPQVGRVTAFRHVLKPNVSLSYQATRADTGGILGVGGDSRPWKQTRRITGRLDNTFWVKVQRGEEEAKIRLAQVTFSTSYDMERDIRPLADLVTTVSVAAGRVLDSRLTVRSELYDRQNRLQLLSPRLKQFEVRSSLRWSGRAEDRGEPRVYGGGPDSRDPSGANLYGDDPYAPSAGQMGSGSGVGSYDSQRRREEFGYDGGLQRDLRGRRRHLTLSHYYARTRYTSTTTSRSWLRATAGVGWRRRWHFQYSLNYNLRDPGTPLLSTDRVTSELLSVQRAFHDWTATVNIEPSQFHRDRAFFFKAQFKDIPQIKFERGDGRL